jgi:protein-disulfide isomerase
MPLYWHGLSCGRGNNGGRFDEKIYFVFRNFPLREIHPHAQHAAEAAEAAAAQDKFWQMHDYLFEHQKALDDHHLLEYAQKVGLDIERFQKGNVRACLRSSNK